MTDRTPERKHGLTETQKARVTELLAARHALFKHEGRVYKVDEDVFPPQTGYTTSRILRAVARYAATSTYALDMGCGMGIVAFVMKTHGARHVWGVDFHVPAIRNSKRNAADHPDVGEIEFRRSNLFAAIPARIKFDLVVFNQPYYPLPAGSKVMGMGADGGREIIQRFLWEVPHHCASNVRILMTFSELSGPENDPAGIAMKMGFSVSTLAKGRRDGMMHFIYEVSHAR